LEFNSEGRRGVPQLFQSGNRMSWHAILRTRGVSTTFSQFTGTRTYDT